ncbi:MAG: fenitrothion hydrolase [Actinomycetota bacterium]|nr:fenitrothion hydrolase [Actinomycetota bacterium]
MPDWLFFWGGAVVLVLSFLALGVLWKRPQLDRRAGGRPLPSGLDRVLRSRVLQGILGALSAALLVLVFLTALLGEPSSAQNFSPTFVYVVFWLGLVPVQVLLGNVWPVLNPWLAIANGFSWIWHRLGQTWAPPLTYSERLGVWPAAFLLFYFAVLELAYSEPASPRALALAVAIYSYTMWFGMAAVGRREWSEKGDAFTVYFGLLSRIAPFGERDGRLVARMPLSGLARAETTPGMLAFVAVMLGSVGFDGLGRAPFWQNLRADLESPHIIDSPGTAELIGTGLSLLGLVGCVLLVALAYRAAVAVAHRMLETDRPLGAEFLSSLIPIALVYAVAHYLTLLVIQGQYILPLASDPFGFGWDILGTVDYSPNIAPFSPNTVWYVQVGALVAGHVAGLAVAHDRAVTILPERDALRSQYAMLGLMVLYTMAGLWLLSNG